MYISKQATYFKETTPVM